MPTAEDDTDTTLDARLLADLRDVFGDAEAIYGETILAALHMISEAPWGDYFGRPMNGRNMAKLLKPYGIKWADVKLGGTNRKGYRRDHLHETWIRYLSHADATRPHCRIRTPVTDTLPARGPRVRGSRRGKLR